MHFALRIYLPQIVNTEHRTVKQFQDKSEGGFLRPLSDSLFAVKDVSKSRQRALRKLANTISYTFRYSAAAR